MNESPQYEAFRAFARAEIRALVLEVKNDLKEILTREAPKVVEGPAGKDGTPGKDGIDGKPGRDGVDGKDGSLGERGAPGLNGKDGEPGKDGSPSTIPGPKGDTGERGADGIATEAEIDAKIEARFADMQTRSLADYHKRTYEKGTSYKRGDLTVWDGTTWLAMSDTTTVPGTSTDWQQFAKKGRDGRDRTDKGPYSK